MIKHFNRYKKCSLCNFSEKMHLNYSIFYSFVTTKCQARLRSFIHVHKHIYLLRAANTHQYLQNTTIMVEQHLDILDPPAALKTLGLQLVSNSMYPGVEAKEHDYWMLYYAKINYLELRKSLLFPAAVKMRRTAKI